MFFVGPISCKGGLPSFRQEALATVRWPFRSPLSSDSLGPRFHLTSLGRGSRKTRHLMLSRF